MEMDNTKGKSCDTIPYMIINLDCNNPVYICKDTPIAYINEEDISCEYLEVNEIVESMQGINWVPLSKHKIVKSDFSCTDHRTPKSGTERSQCIKGD